MATTGVRALKAKLSEYLKRAKAGERVTVTDRGRPIAILGPAASEPSLVRLEALLSTGLAHWGGGKPRGAKRLARAVRGASVARAIIEDRR